MILSKEKIVRYIIILITFISAVSCMSNTPRPDLRVRIRLDRQFDSLYREDKNNFTKIRTYDIRIFLINQNNRPISYWIMSCDWQRNFETNNSTYSFMLEECNKNSPVVRTLNAGDSISYSATVVNRNGYAYQNKDTFDLRLGFIFVDRQKCKSPDSYLHIMKDRSMQNEIQWSNSLRVF